MDASAGGCALVLVVLSSTFQDQGACLQRIADALATLPVRAVLTTGPALDPGTATAPPNVTVLPAAPHAQVLEQASAVITHGGHGTVIRALAAGVPLLVLPHGRDQGDNAVRITERGARLTVKRTARPELIAEALDRVLNEPSFREAAHRLGQAIVDDVRHSSLLDELEDLPAAPHRALLRLNSGAVKQTPTARHPPSAKRRRKARWGSDGSVSRRSSCCFDVGVRSRPIDARPGCGGPGTGRRSGEDDRLGTLSGVPD